MKRSYISWRWYLLPLALMLGFVGQATYKSAGISNRNEAIKLATYPVIEAVDIKHRLDGLSRRIEGRQMSPDEYFATLAELDILEKATRRKEGASKNSNDYRAVGMTLFLARSLQNDLANKHSRSLPTHEIEAARDRHPNMLFDERQVAQGSEFAPFGLAYLLVALIAAPIFFFIRLRREGLMVIPELAWRFPFWVLLWPVGLFKYPVNIDVREQARRFKQWLAALVSMLLGMSPVAMAHAKSGSGKLGGVEVVQVEQQGPTILVVDSSKPQLLPTLVVDGVEFNFPGWVHIEASAKDERPQVEMLKIRATADAGDIHFFSQWDPRRGNPIDEIWVAHGDASNLRITAGYVFHSAALSSGPPPFLQESISAPSVPVAYFGTGVMVEGAINENISFAVDVTGDSRAKPFSGQMFDRLDVSGNIQRTHEGGFVRLSAQSAGDLRVVVDGKHKFGPNEVRAAVYYRSKDDQLGGYVFLSREMSKAVKVFTQFELENERFHALLGLQFVANDNLNFTVETSNDNAWRLRARGRF